jgi:uncharacterized Zn-binding protein involved in type VI secretion
MRRFYLREGDKSTAGGTVLEGFKHCTIYGVAQTFVGAKVYCPACKHTGEIVANGPRLKDTIMGKDAALSDDLCACKCARWPVLLPSQDTDYQDIIIKPDQTAKHGAPDGARSALVHDERYVLRDRRTGKPLVNVAYRLVSASGETVEGVTDGTGSTRRIKTGAAQTIKVEIKETE